MLLKELKVLGISEGEIKVFSAVLHIGLSNINKIHEITGFERRAIYDIINKLIEKGLISYMIEKGKKTYQCASPNKIKEDIKRKKKEIENLEKTMPYIETEYAILKPQINAQVFRGKEGIKYIFEDMLGYPEARFLGGGWYIIKELPYFWPQYNKKRIELKIKWFNLLRYELRRERISKNKLVSLKYLPIEFSGSPSAIFIYGNKVVNVLWSNVFFAFMIESDEIAKNYLKYFEYIWNNIAKPP